MGKLLLTILCALTYATVFHYWPKDKIRIDSGPTVEIFSQNGVVTEEARR